MPPLPASTNRSSAEAQGRTVIARGARRRPSQSTWWGAESSRTGSPIADALHVPTPDLPRYPPSFISQETHR